MGVNSITLVGRAGRDPEVRYFESGSVVANLTLAVNRRSRDDEPDWFNLEIWGKQAQVAADYVRKGSLLGVIGSFKLDRWTDRTSGEERSKPFGWIGWSYWEASATLKPLVAASEAVNPATRKCRSELRAVFRPAPNHYRSARPGASRAGVAQWVSARFFQMRSPSQDTDARAATTNSTFTTLATGSIQSSTRL
jgi:single-strand DNA-binding protein